MAMYEFVVDHELVNEIFIDNVKPSIAVFTNADMSRGDSMFQKCYRCYSVSFIDKAHLENGDKIIMPPSALDRLASLRIEYPMLFELSNISEKRITHCGVLEFVADEGIVYLPYWMMQNMLLQEGDLVKVKNTSLLKGTYMKLQPHTQNFLDISNPKAILETTLRTYSCLTTGDTIMVPYNNKNYYIDIVETKPSSAVSIIETDCEVDFAPPLDYKEPEKPKKPLTPTKRPLEVEEEQQMKVPKFTPFTGSGRRLDGKSSEQISVPISNQQEQTSENGKEDIKRLESAGRRSGKLVFGSNANRVPEHQTNIDSKNESREVLGKIKESKFEAFKGKKYTLNG